MYPSPGSDAECILESNAHVTIMLEAFTASPISNAVYHALQEAPCISRDSGDNGTHHIARGLPAYAAVHDVSTSVIVTSFVVVKPRHTDH